MTPQGLGRVAEVLQGLGLSAGDADETRRRQVLRRILPVTGAPTGAAAAMQDPFARTLLDDIAAVGRELAGSGADPLDDRDRYRWEETRRAALRRGAEAAPRAGLRARRALAPAVVADARAIIRLEGRVFVAEALVRILGRPADPDAMRHYTELLRRGAPKARILREITASPEGRWKRVYVRGLWQTTRVFRHRVLVPAPVAWTARLLSRRRYHLG